MVRKPAVAGQFYPGGAKQLAADVAVRTISDQAPSSAIGVVSPHAGYLYSGTVAGRTYASVVVPGTVILLGPNHTGVGGKMALWGDGSWDLPGSVVPVNAVVGDGLRRVLPSIIDDRSAHVLEHSLEVQVPFLLRRNAGVSLVPLCLGPLSIGECREMGEAVAEVVAGAGEGILIVASSDMSHYEPDATVRRKDRLAIDRMLALDAEGLYRTVAREGISMCGVIPVTVMLFAAIALGATRSELAAYATSGEASGDFEQVVGYAGIVVR
jgi:hypothetical protein